MQQRAGRTLNEWPIVERVLTSVITEAQAVEREENPFLPKRHTDDNYYDTEES